MKIGITLNDETGMEGDVCAHFGQCSHFLIVEADGGKMKNSKVVKNEAVHGGGGCQAVGEILKHEVTHVVSGGMGMGAQNKFAEAGVKIFSFQGKAKDAIAELLNSKLATGIEACKEHGDHQCH